jgi:hypothetical protein
MIPHIGYLSSMKNSTLHPSRTLHSFTALGFDSAFIAELDDMISNFWEISYSFKSIGHGSRLSRTLIVELIVSDPTVSGNNVTWLRNRLEDMSQCVRHVTLEIN